MAFRFSLAAVLRLREIDEQREERLLTQILAQLAQTRMALESVERQLGEAARQRETSLQASTGAAELQSCYALAAALRERRQRTVEELASVGRRREEQMRVYQAAHQAHEVLRTMEAEQRAGYTAEQARREQKIQDDTFLARRGRR
ncbi:MAG TPA: flagellar FliJ family protein [Acidobacteriaceae bacterium]